MIDLAFLEQQFRKYLKSANSKLNPDEEFAYIKQAISTKPKFHEATGESVDTMLNSIAGTGLSLCPTKQLCFLDVRSRKVNDAYVSEAIFDISYRGLVKLATESGCQYLRADVVRANDYFEYHGPAEKASFSAGTDTRNVFTSDRGEVVGAFAEVALANGTSLTEIVNKADLEAAGALSRGGAWKSSFVDELRKKVAIKRLFKTLPGITPEMTTAVQAADNADGVHLAEIEKIDSPFISDKTLDAISKIIKENKLDQNKIIDFCSKKLRYIESLGQLTDTEGVMLLKKLRKQVEEKDDEN
jgi:recombinational DNA repair protein RecT